MEKYEAGKLHSFLAVLSFRKGFPLFRSTPTFPCNSVTALEKWPYQLQHSCCSWLRDKLITQFGDNISLDRKIPYWSIQSSIFFSRQAESSLTRRNCELMHTSYLSPFFLHRQDFRIRNLHPKARESRQNGFRVKIAKIMLCTKHTFFCKATHWV